MTPAHVAPPGTSLSPGYFSPGTSLMHGKVVCSLWAIAYWRGSSYRYEREGFGARWIRVA